MYFWARPTLVDSQVELGLIPSLGTRTEQSVVGRVWVDPKVMSAWDDPKFWDARLGWGRACENIILFLKIWSGVLKIWCGFLKIWCGFLEIWCEFYEFDSAPLGRGQGQSKKHNMFRKMLMGGRGSEQEEDLTTNCLIVLLIYKLNWENWNVISPNEARGIQINKTFDKSPSGVQIIPPDGG